MIRPAAPNQPPRLRLAAGKFADEHFARVVAAGAHTRQRVVGPFAHTDGTVGVAAGRQAPNWGKDDILKFPLTMLQNVLISTSTITFAIQLNSSSYCATKGLRGLFHCGQITAHYIVLKCI